MELDKSSTDKELFDAASTIVCIPKKPGNEFWDASFLLHAPLEMCARYFLLPLVDDSHVEGARKQIRMTAKKYYAYENQNNVASSNSFPSFEISKVDVVKWSSSLQFAGHASILLSMSKKLGETNQSIESVLWTMYNSIDGDLGAHINLIGDSTGKEVSAELLQHPQNWFFENVGNIKHVDGPSDSIKGGVEAVQNAGLIEPLIETIDSIAGFSDRADFDLPFRVLLRMATLSMLTEDEEHSKYGWTHCLTIPHAIWTLVDNASSKGAMLQAATTHVATFRSLNSKSEIEPNELVEYFEEDEHSVFAEHYVRMTDIISQACVLEDAHLVKYVYTCFDMMKRDPQYSKLYIAAAGKLLAIWQPDAATT